MTGWVEVMGLRQRLRLFASNSEGIASLEFVLILFPMIFIFFGMVQWGIMMYHFNQMENAARETARIMAVDDDMNPNSDGADVQCSAAVSGSAEGFFCSMVGVPSVGKVTACYNQDATPPADDAVFSAMVTITAPMDAVGMIDVFGITKDRDMTVTAEMRVENGKFHVLNVPNPCLCGGASPDFGFNPLPACGP